ncbi:MAG TPA: hypothetical protein VE135_03410 [Pyrinomonadaceae bacterium]|nr:hypothetical protein [Pyrinomonadaceae bacterium]
MNSSTAYLLGLFPLAIACPANYHDWAANSDVVNCVRDSGYLK